MPEGRADVNALGFARAFDTPAFRAEVAAQLSGRLGAAERVAFPAVLGIASPHAVWSELSHRLGRVVFEVPTLPPSVPGMRVYATLRDALRRAGGRRSSTRRRRRRARGARVTRGARPGRAASR